MKKLIFILLVALGSSNVQAQDIKVFNHYDFSKSFSKNLSQTSFTFGQFLQFHKILDFKLFVSGRFTASNLKATTLTAYQGSDSLNTQLIKSTLRSNLSVPLGLEISLKGIGVGISTEILNLGLGNSLALSRFKSLPSAVTTVYPLGASSIFIAANNRNSSTQIYAVYTLNESFSLKAGLNTQNVIYSFKDTNKDIIGKAGYKNVAPFVSMRFNIEK